MLFFSAFHKFWNKSEARTSGRTSSNPHMSITDLIMSYWPWCGLYSPDWLYVLRIYKLLICFKSESGILKDAGAEWAIDYFA